MPGSKPLRVRLQQLQGVLLERHARGQHQPLLLSAERKPAPHRRRPQQPRGGRACARNRHGRWVVLPRPAHMVASKTAEQWHVSAVGMTVAAVTWKRSLLDVEGRVKAAEEKAAAAEARALEAEKEATVAKAMVQANRWARVLTVMCCAVKSETRDQAAFRAVSEAREDLAPVSDLGGETKGHVITEQWSEEWDPVEAHLSWLECVVQGTVAPDGYSWYKPSPRASCPQLQEAPAWLRAGGEYWNSAVAALRGEQPPRRQYWLADLTWALFKRWRSDLRWLEFLHTAVLMQACRIKELGPRWTPEVYLRWVPLAMRTGVTKPDQMPHLWTD